MAVALRQSRSFDSDSPVTRYWLANCVGFSVIGGDHGTVEGVLTELHPHEPEVLVLRTSTHRVKHLPTSAVVAVVPQDRVLVTEQRPSVAARRARTTGRVATRAALRSTVFGAWLLAMLAAGGWRLTRRGVVYASPRVARLARGSGTRTVRLVRSVPWQRYALSVRSATTRRSPDRSPGS